MQQKGNLEVKAVKVLVFQHICYSPKTINSFGNYIYPARVGQFTNGKSLQWTVSQPLQDLEEIRRSGGHT